MGKEIEAMSVRRALLSSTKQTSHAPSLSFALGSHQPSGSSASGMGAEPAPGTAHTSTALLAPRASITRLTHAAALCPGTFTAIPLLILWSRSFLDSLGFLEL